MSPPCIPPSFRASVQSQAGPFRGGLYLLEEEEVRVVVPVEKLQVQLNLLLPRDYLGCACGYSKRICEIRSNMQYSVR